MEVEEAYSLLSKEEEHSSTCECMYSSALYSVDCSNSTRLGIAEIDKESYSFQCHRLPRLVNHHHVICNILHVTKPAQERSGRDHVL
jgi:hypothetical protein